MGNDSPHFFPSKNPNLGGDLGGWRPPASPWLQFWSGRRRERKGGWGRRGCRGPRTLALSRQPSWRDSIVVPLHAAQLGGPRHRRPSAALAQAASVATLSRHMHWRDRGYSSHQVRWRDQMGYFLQIKTVEIKILLTKKLKIKKTSRPSPRGPACLAPPTPTAINNLPLPPKLRSQPLVFSLPLF